MCPASRRGSRSSTQTQHFRLTYDTPYIRNLPTRLEITTSTETDTGTEIFGPVYEDPFRLQLDALHEAIVHGAPVKTSIEDAAADLRLFAEVARHFAVDRSPAFPDKFANPLQSSA